MRQRALRSNVSLSNAECGSVTHNTRLGQAAAKPLVASTSPHRSRLRRASSALAAISKHSELRQDSRFTTNPGSTILLAEDDYLVRTVVGSGLALYGYEVLAASDGEEAMTLLYRHARQISLALIDLGMPKRPGHEVVALIRSLGLSIPIIVTSGFELKDVSHISGLTAYLKKPFEIPDLIEQVRAVLPRE